MTPELLAEMRKIGLTIQDTKQKESPMAHQLNKGKIRDNALKALVRSNLFRHKTERKKKGKGSYNRQAAKKWRDGFEQPSRFDLYRYPDNRLSPPCPPPIPYGQFSSTLHVL